MMHILSFLLLFWGGSAHAWTPSPSYILNQTLKFHDNLKTLALEAQVTDLRTNQSFREVLKIEFPAARVVASYIGSNNELLGGVDTHLKDLAKLGKFWIEIALDPNGSRFRQALADLGILPKESTEAKLSRVGNLVTWMWGESEQAQFLKDEFVPVDYHVGGTGASSQEIFLKDYGSAAVRLPRNVYVKLDGKEAYRFELKGLKVNMPLKYPAMVTAISQASVKEWTQLVR